MSASRGPSWTWAWDDRGIATMMEYILLLAVSLAVFLAMLAALNVGAATARSDAAALAAEKVASGVSEAIGEAVGDGTLSASVPVSLPPEICGYSYLVYPSADGRYVIVAVNQPPEGRVFKALLPLRKEGIHITGFLVSGRGDRTIRYDADTGTVTVS